MQKKKKKFTLTNVEGKQNPDGGWDGYVQTTELLDSNDDEVDKISPIEQVPLEVLNYIINLFDDVISILRSRCVCKKWNDLINENGNCIKRIEIARLVMHTGWCGNINRVEAEKLVSSAEKGKFLFRYSPRALSYVCTVKGEKDIDHIADIKPDKEKGGIKVYKFNGTTSHLRSLKRYVDFMMNKGIMTSPVRIDDKKLNIEEILADKNIPDTLLSDIGYLKENNSNDNLRKLLSRSEGTNIRQKDLKTSEDTQVELKESKRAVTFEDATPLRKTEDPKNPRRNKATKAISGFFAKFSKSADDIGKHL